MYKYLSKAPTLDTTAPNLKQTVTYMNIKSVGFANSHGIHVNYPVGQACHNPKDTKNT
jgi:hypothetical protein